MASSPSKFGGYLSEGLTRKTSRFLPVANGSASEVKDDVLLGTWTQLHGEVLISFMGAKPKYYIYIYGALQTEFFPYGCCTSYSVFHVLSIYIYNVLVYLYMSSVQSPC